MIFNDLIIKILYTRVELATQQSYYTRALQFVNDRMIEVLYTRAQLEYYFKNRTKMYLIYLKKKR